MAKLIKIYKQNIIVLAKRDQTFYVAAIKTKREENK